MRKVLTAMIGLVLVSAVAAFASCGSCGEAKAASSCGTKAACSVKDVYVCSMCKIGAKEAGKCSKCEMDLVKMHVLACSDDTVSLCSCTGDCKCTAKDDGKCSCGKDIVKIAMKDIPGCGGCKAPPEKPAEAPAKAK